MAHKTYVIDGKVIDNATGQGVPGLRVEAWDKDPVYDDLVGSATTDEEGAFKMQFDEAYFLELFVDHHPDLYFLVFMGDDLLKSTEDSILWNVDVGSTSIEIGVDLPPAVKTSRDVYLKIEPINDYNPVWPTEHVPASVTYKRDCMRNTGHANTVIPDEEVVARAVEAVVYREYEDADYLVPKTNKLVQGDINEPAYHHRVPGTVLYAHPGEILRIHILNADNMPHSFHLHGLEYGIDSDGAWPFGTQSNEGRRSDEICPGQSWTYTFCATEHTIGLWPFHDHSRQPASSIDRGLFGGLIVLPKKKPKPPIKPFKPIEDLKKLLKELPPVARLRPMDRLIIHNQLEWVKERLQLELVKPVNPGTKVLHVPLFFHVMRSAKRKTVFDTGDIHELGGTKSIQFKKEGVFEYFCTHHANMTGKVRVEAGEPPSATVTIKNGPNKRFDPDDVLIGVNGMVEWVNTTGVHHTATAKGAPMTTHCFNGRGFVGNSPTIVGYAGQKIRWYVFNLDVGQNWHNFHPHTSRWQFGNETIDVRSLGPAESFIVETEVPNVLLLTEEMKKVQDPKKRPKGAKLYRLKGDFLFHCHVHHHLMNGMAGLIRAKQKVWLTQNMVDEIKESTGLALDDFTNDCPDVDIDRCKKMVEGKVEIVPGSPEVIMMHSALLPQTDKVLFWGKTRTDQSRLWDYKTGVFSVPVNQPALLPGETAASSDLWSAAHAFTNKDAGLLLAHGGLTDDAAGNPTKSYLFDPATNTWSPAANTTHGRFYASTIPLGDGKLLTLFGTGGPPPINTIEVYDPATNTWSPPKTMPGNYFYYPWLYLLPDGELFIAGPQETTRKFDWTATPIPDDPAKRWITNKGNRGGNMTGSSVLLPLRPPNYKPVVLIMGGSPAATQKSLEYIDLSVPAPAWKNGPDMNQDRVQCTAVLLPDGRVFVGGGIPFIANGGPVETLDPQNLADGWKQGPELTYKRLYHSSMILLPDGSVFIGGDDDGADPCERYYPGYYGQPRPQLIGAPSSVHYDEVFTIQAPNAPLISEVILMRPGAVTHGFDMSQRAVELVITGGGANTIDVKAPPHANIAPPGYYLLFILNASRVPSIGQWIRMTRP